MTRLRFAAAARFRHSSDAIAVVAMPLNDLVGSTAVTRATVLARPGAPFWAMMRSISCSAVIGPVCSGNCAKGFAGGGGVVVAIGAQILVLISMTGWLSGQEGSIR